MIFDTDEYSENFFTKKKIPKSQLSRALAEYLKISSGVPSLAIPEPGSQKWVSGFTVGNGSDQLRMFVAVGGGMVYPFLCVGEVVEPGLVGYGAVHLAGLAASKKSKYEFVVTLPADPVTRREYLPCVKKMYDKQSRSVSLHI